MKMKCITPNSNNQYPHHISIHAPNNMNHIVEDIDKRSLLLEARNTLLPQIGSKKITQPPRTHCLQQQQKEKGVGDRRLSKINSRSTTHQHLNIKDS